MYRLLPSSPTSHPSNTAATTRMETNPSLMSQTWTTANPPNPVTSLLKSHVSRCHWTYEVTSRTRTAPLHHLLLLRQTLSRHPSLPIPCLLLEWCMMTTLAPLHPLHPELFPDRLVIRWQRRGLLGSGGLELFQASLPGSIPSIYHSLVSLCLNLNRFHIVFCIRELYSICTLFLASKAERFASDDDDKWEEEGIARFSKKIQGTREGKKRRERESLAHFWTIDLLHR